MKNIKYVLISPVRDEEETIIKTINSVIKQTILPNRWIFIDNNSIDNTSRIIDDYVKKHGFIERIFLNEVKKRTPGRGPVRAFNYGIEHIDIFSFDFIIKLDGDMEFADNYFEEIFKKFNQNPKLGIASGLILEKESLKPSKKHFFELTQGNTKVYKKECFEKIHPLDEVKGWDFIDNIKAKYFGFDTRIFKNITATHLKPLDIKVGYKNENYLKGYYDAFFKYPLIFMFVKGFKKLIFEKPYLFNGLYYFKGFLKNKLFDKNFYKDKRIIQFLHKYQMDRLKTLIFNYKKYY